ncbi:MAG: hypothetical protein AAFV85_07765 [Cyanobacteria bacterium J06634_6]
MTRLSDRTFQILKDEVNRHYMPTPEQRLSQQQDVERIILIARLEALHEQSGQAVTQAQLWEELCDIVPNFDRQILRRVGRVDITKPLADASFGLGVAGISATLLLANPFNLQASQQGESSQAIADTSNASRPSSMAASRSQNLYETAKAFGWQAAVKGQNPPHSVQHWRETASLWAQAIALLDQVPPRDRFYPIAQTKKAEYQRNLKQIQARQAAAQDNNRLIPKPQFSRRIAQTKPTSPPAVQRSVSGVAAAAEATSTAATVASVATPPPAAAAQTAAQGSALELAKQYGWDAAIAAQNAPHPAEKWADISRTWQLAIHSLNQVDTEHPDYAEAQQVKERYEHNLSIIRIRYQQEQDASQRLQSLQASLAELDRISPVTSPARYSQMQAIVERLQSIPAGTVAYKQAQQLIANIQAQMPEAPYKREGTAIAISD